MEEEEEEEEEEEQEEEMQEKGPARLYPALPGPIRPSSALSGCIRPYPALSGSIRPYPASLHRACDVTARRREIDCRKIPAFRRHIRDQLKFCMSA